MFDFFDIRHHRAEGLIIALVIIQINQFKKFTWSGIHGLDLFSRLQVPETDVCVKGAGGCDRPVVTDVH